MNGMLGYQWRLLLRSYRYFAPMFVFLLILTLVYTEVPNPVMPSYAFSSALLFAAAAWLAYAWMDAEPAAAQMIASIHAGGLARPYAAKLAVAWFMGALLGIFAVVYPALTGKFDRPPVAAEILVALAGHGLAAMVGVGSGAWFTRKLVDNRSMAILLLFAVVSLGLAGNGLAAALPAWGRPLVWLTPPVFYLVRTFELYETARLADKTGALLVPLLYGTLACVAFVWVMSRRKF